MFIYSLNPLFALALFSFVWINDTFAYLVGITIGKHKLCPKISPKKSWEGFFGGLVFTVLASVAFHQFTVEILAGFSLMKWIGLAIITVISATFGDLSESLFKRSLHVKDSGTFLPGHGGFLDRFDSILLVVLVAIHYLWWVN
jgi:phosphatidate cytidylyltransferase